MRGSITKPAQRSSAGPELTQGTSAPLQRFLSKEDEEDVKLMPNIMNTFNLSD